jgi:hypothetical protein
MRFQITTVMLHTFYGELESTHFKDGQKAKIPRKGMCWFAVMSVTPKSAQEVISISLEHRYSKETPEEAIQCLIDALGGKKFVPSSPVMFYNEDYRERFPPPENMKEYFDRAAQYIQLKTADITEFEAMCKYVEHHGAIHDENCPEDDTCNCSWKPVNDAVNRVVNTLQRETE